MPRDTRTISVFLASPSDVSSEREIIARTIAEWNQIRGQGLAINFELLRWERNVSAGFASDGQEVITKGIGDSYDALIAVFWTRIGTETPRAESGSIEEYERTLVRRQSGEDVEIACFFKDAPVSLKSVDLAQLQSLGEFKGRLEREGALYKEFSDDSILRFEINLLLDRLARKFSLGDVAREESLVPRSSNAASGSLLETNTKSNEIGFIDVSESLEEHSLRAQGFLAEMTARLEQMTSENSDVTKEMEELGKLGTVSPSLMKPLIARVAESMNAFSDFMERGMTDYSEHSLGIAEDTRSLIDLARDFEYRDNEASDLEATLDTLLVSMTEANDGVQGMLTSTEGLQRMTVAFNHARKRLASNLRSYLSDLGNTRTVVMQAIEELRQLRRDNQ